MRVVYEFGPLLCENLYKFLIDNVNRCSYNFRKGGKNMNSFDTYLEKMTLEQKIQFLIFLQTLTEGSEAQPLSDPA